MKKKVAVITGSSSGIGKCLAEVFLSQDYNVIGIDMSDASIQHKKYTHFLCDVTNTAHVTQLCKKLPKKIDLFINNAGTYVSGNIFEAKEEDIHKQIDIHVFSFWRFMSQLKKRVKSLIVISSYHGTEIITSPGAYSLAKNALNALVEMAKQTFGVKTLLVCPGPVETPLANRNKTAQQIQKVRKLRIQPQKLSRLIFKAYMKNKNTLIYKSKTRTYSTH